MSDQEIHGGWQELAGTARTELTADEQIRIAALQIAASIGEASRTSFGATASVPGKKYTSADTVTVAAEHIRRYIMMGEQ
jgi:hypothetical protein